MRKDIFGGCSCSCSFVGVVSGLRLMVFVSLILSRLRGNGPLVEDEVVVVR